jgi:hypothetical protein
MFNAQNDLYPTLDIAYHHNICWSSQIALEKIKMSHSRKRTEKWGLTGKEAIVIALLVAMLLVVLMLLL